MKKKSSKQCDDDDDDDTFICKENQSMQDFSQSILQTKNKNKIHCMTVDAMLLLQFAGLQCRIVRQVCR